MCFRGGKGGRGGLRYCWYWFRSHCMRGIKNSKGVVPLMSCNNVVGEGCVGIGYVEGRGRGVDVCV